MSFDEFEIAEFRSAVLKYDLVEHTAAVGIFAALTNDAQRRRDSAVLSRASALARPETRRMASPPL